MRRNVLPGPTHDPSVRASCHGSRSPVQRGAGYCPCAHSKQFRPASRVTVRCSWRITIDGRSGPYSGPLPIAGKRGSASALPRLPPRSQAKQQPPLIDPGSPKRQSRQRPMTDCYDSSPSGCAQSRWTASPSSGRRLGSTGEAAGQAARYEACGDIRPITWPSGSLKSPITIPTPGTSSGPIILVPARLSAFSSAAPTSATWT